MSEPAPIGAEARARTLDRFAEHRRAWRDNEALRILYRRWYERVRAALPAAGPWLELGSGPGFAREVIPELELSDVVKAPWHDREVDAEQLPFGEGALGALVLFDVLHHLPRPARFFHEATRVLRRGGRIVLCEPYVSALSFPVYRFLHEERCDLGVDPLGDVAGVAGEPFDGNQAIPTRLLAWQRARFQQRFPELRVTSFERLAGPAYPASGGFSRPPLVPLPIWKTLLALEDRVPAVLMRLIGFRLLAVIERR